MPYSATLVLTCSLIIPKFNRVLLNLGLVNEEALLVEHSVVIAGLEVRLSAAFRALLQGKLASREASSLNVNAGA